MQEEKEVEDLVINEVDEIYEHNDPIQVTLDIREERTGTIYGKCNVFSKP